MIKNEIRNGIALKAVWLLAIGLGITSFGSAQPGGNPGRDKDPMQEYFYPPELVMRYQNDIQLRQEQRETILGAMDEAQKKFNHVQWDLQNAMSLFHGLLAQPAIDEQKALDQLDKVLDLERQVKKTQVTLMMKIKNALTGDQKEKLKSLRLVPGS